MAVAIASNTRTDKPLTSPTPNNARLAADGPWTVPRGSWRKIVAAERKGDRRREPRPQLYSP
jgi:hypothetical protein